MPWKILNDQIIAHRQSRIGGLIDPLATLDPPGSRAAPRQLGVIIIVGQARGVITDFGGV